MSVGCGCGGCISRGRICVPRGNDRGIVFNVYDSDGAEYDITGAQEIIFIVADGVVIGGNVGPGGTVLINKTLTDGDIEIAGTGYQFVVTMVPADTADLTKTTLYFEAEVTSSAGLVNTVSNGVFSAENTMIKDI